MQRFHYFASLPNLITLGRLVLVPFVIAMISGGRWKAAFAAFLIAGVSDAVDGFLAKRFDLRTDLGAYLDPIADKALLISIYVALSITAVTPPWLAILVVSRDMMILGAVVVAWLLDRPLAIRPLLISKINTAGQIGFACWVLAAKAFGWPFDPIFHPALYLVALLTTLSAGAYLLLWLRYMTDDAPQT